MKRSELDAVPEESPRKPKKKEVAKDPYRFVVLVIFVIILFISYAFWIQGQ